MIGKPPLTEQVVNVTVSDLERLLERAAESGARKVLEVDGVGSEHKDVDLRDIKVFIDYMRFLRRTAGATVVRVVTTGAMCALVTGIAIKLRYYGGD